jgi:acetoin utilization protein AcuC
MSTDPAGTASPTSPPGPCPVDLLWDDRFLEYEFGDGHPFSEKSRHLAVELLESSGFFAADGRTRHRSFLPADREVLRRFHVEEYLDRIARASASPRRTILDTGDTPGFAGCFEATARIVAGTVQGIELLRERPATHLFQPGGGLHHAHPDAASGFCIFNDVAVAIATALGSGGFRRVAYVDIDAHHGDGVMYGFYRDGRVLDIDFHQDGRTLFPGTGNVSEIGSGDGAGLKVNVPLPPGAGTDALLALFRTVVPPLLREYRPELIVLQAGVDGHAGDPLTRLRYTPKAYRTAIFELHRLAHEVAGGRLLVTGGGGYLPESVSRVLAQDAFGLAGAEPPGADTPLPEEWRRRFEETSGRPAPTHWEDRHLPAAETDGKAHAEELLRDLSRRLGREFPSPGPASSPP